MRGKPPRLGLLALAAGSCGVLLTRPAHGILYPVPQQIPPDNMRRHLSPIPYDSYVGAETLEGVDWEAYQDRCASADVALYLSIGIHFALYAQPVSLDNGIAGTGTTDCAPVWLHADSSGEEGKVKGVLSADDKKLPVGFIDGEGSIWLGTFRFQDVASAFNAVDIDSPGSRNYNIVTNNCAVLILGMMRALGIQLSPQDRRKVADGLVAADRDADNKLAEYIRDSGEIEQSLGLTGDATNEQLLERLTLRQISLALDSPAESEANADDKHRRLHQRGEAVSRGQRHTLEAGGGGLSIRHRDLIIRGVPVSGQEFPFYVQSEYASNATESRFPDDAPPCGAVLVAPDVILTAASCYTQFQYSRKVLVGSTNFSTVDSLSEWRNITSDIVVHPLHDRSSPFVYDFALMKIEAVSLPNLVPAEFSTDKSFPAANQQFTIVGFGNTRETSEIKPAKVLRKVNVTTTTWSVCNAAFTVSKSEAFCAYAKNAGPCRGDFGGPVINSDGKLVSLARYSAFDCVNNDDKPTFYLRISFALEWIRETICQLSDFRGNYTFCPTLVCPPPLTLLGSLNGTKFYGGASLPLVTGSMLSPVQSNVSQVPAAGKPLKPGKRQVVWVAATDSNNVTSTCNWTVTVPEVDSSQSIVEFRAKARNTSSYKIYTLDVPFAGNFLYVEAYVSFSIERTRKAVIDLTFQRIDRFNTSDRTVLQSFVIRGKKILKQTFNVTAQVSCPDPSSYLYVAFFKSSGILKGGKVKYTLNGQLKKM